MSKPSERERLNVFRRMLDNYSAFSNSESTKAPCPLCLSELGEESVLTKEFSAEHIVPKSLGGKRWLLTCETCNNTMGSKVEGDLSRYFKAEDAMTGKGSVAATLLVGGNRTRTELTWAGNPDETVRMKVLKKATNPHEEQGTIQALKDGVKDIKMNIDFGYRIQRYQVALLKMAYLACFDRLGYSYVLNPSLEIIRNQLRKPDEHFPELSPLYLAATNLSEQLPMEFAIGRERSLDCIVVLGKFITQLTHHRAILMPREGADTNSFLEMLAEKKRQNWKAQITFRL